MANTRNAKTIAGDIVSLVSKSAHGAAWTDELDGFGRELLHELIHAAAAANPTPHALHLAKEFISATKLNRNPTTVARKLKEMIDEERRSPTPHCKESD